MKNFKQVYLDAGIRRPSDLSSPRVKDLTAFELPLNVGVHYLGHGVEMGPRYSLPPFNGKGKGAWILHLSSYQSTAIVGDFVHLTAALIKNIGVYQRQNREFRWLRRDPATIRDKNFPIVYNYATLHSVYKYRAYIRSTIDQVTNTLATVLSRANDAAKETQRQQIIPIDVPEQMLPLAEMLFIADAISGHDGSLRGASVNQSRLAGPLSNISSRTFIELWRWLSDNESANSLFNLIAPENRERVNLLLQGPTGCTLLNLGLLFSWRKPVNVEEDTNINSLAVPSAQLQRRMMIAFNILNNISETSEKLMVTAAKGKPETNDDDEVDPSHDSISLVFDDKDDVVVDNFDDESIDALLASFQTASDAIEGELVSNDIINAVTETAPYNVHDKTVVGSIQDTLNTRIAKGALGPTEQQKFNRLLKDLNTIKNPFGEGTMMEYASVDWSALTINDVPTIPDNDNVADKSMLKNSLMEFDQRYIKEVLPRNILGAVVAAQQGNFIIREVNTERVVDLGNDYTVMTVGITAINGGAASTLTIKWPNPGLDGVFKSGGVKYYLKKQWGELPIRKVGPRSVALTSYYGKAFIQKSEYSTVNYPRWLNRKITLIGTTPEDTRVTSLRTGDVYYPKALTPRVYSALAKSFVGFNSADMTFNFSYRSREKVFGAEAVKTAEDTFKGIVCGKKGNNLLMMMYDNVICEVEGDKFTALGEIEDILQITDPRPVEMATMSVYSKDVPLAFILGRRLGITKTMATLGTKPRIVPTGRNLNMERYEARIRFKDVSLIFDSRDYRSALVLSGFNAAKASVARYDIAHFDKPDVYGNVLDTLGVTTRYLSEADDFFTLFVDNITRDLLLQMNEPTDVTALCFRAVEMLLTEQYDRDAGWRIKGYERFAGAAYTEITRQIRQRNAKPYGGRSPITMNTEAVWMSIVTDSSREVCSEINPVHNQKQKEVVTFGGTGGRSPKTMVKATRVFKESDKGVISEAGVDSSDVGVISYLTADPNFTSLYGTLGTYDKSKDGMTRMLSTTAMLSPSLEKDDPKRRTFASIQQTHVIGCKGYVVPPLITGYESVIAHRVDDLFATTAAGPGVISKLTSKVLEVTYDDGNVRRVEMGRRYGKAAGTVLPHMIITNLNEGDRVETGWGIAWNEAFFELDPVIPHLLQMKQGVMCNTAMIDDDLTFEDSSVISEAVAAELATEKTEIRTITIDQDQEIILHVKEGDVVTSETILCTFGDHVSSNAKIFTEETSLALADGSMARPKAQHDGVLEKIEVIYNADIETMSETLQTLVRDSDRRTSKLSKALTGISINGKTDKSFRVDSEPLLPGQVAIYFYITATVEAGIGDKSTACNQLKTIHGGIITGVAKTESGIPIGGRFSRHSVSNRIVNSPDDIGTSNTVLILITDNGVKIYDGELNEE